MMQFVMTAKLGWLREDHTSRDCRIRIRRFALAFVWLPVLAAFVCSCTWMSKPAPSAVATESRESTPVPTPSPSSSAREPSSISRPQHVFLIVLENESFNNSFGANSRAPYLSQELRNQGELLTEYYGIGHNSLDNYLAMVSGQRPNPLTRQDCPVFKSFEHSHGLDSNGQVKGSGCIYPPEALTIANQLEVRHLAWGGYMEDMGNTPSQPTACRHPQIGRPDCTQLARTGDQYTARHNPFVYFRSINQADCEAHDLPLDRLASDLERVETTPNLVFITPNLCNDGHDPDPRDRKVLNTFLRGGLEAFCPGERYPEHQDTCADGKPGGLRSIDGFLRKWVPTILGSPAYQKDGMLIITFDEAAIAGPDADFRACCGEQEQGGGRVGALIISPFVKAGSINDHPYNHYALLRSIEDLFGLGHLGFAGRQGLKSFGDDVYNQPHP